jgi:hypothetical protein
MRLIEQYTVQGRIALQSGHHNGTGTAADVGQHTDALVAVSVQHGFGFAAAERIHRGVEYGGVFRLVEQVFKDWPAECQVIRALSDSQPPRIGKHRATIDIVGDIAGRD